MTVVADRALPEEAGNQRGRVLLAEDEPKLRAAYSRVLKRAGYEVTAVADGTEASTLLRSAKFDAVVTDIMMPGADGLEVLKVARAVDEDLPVVIMTAAPNVDTAALAV